MLKKIIDLTILSDYWHSLRKYTFAYERKDGKTETQIREVYDRGNGVAILLYNKEKKSVILTRQFRLPTYVNGNRNGMLIEVCAGSLEEENPRECIIRETKEETGYEIKNPKKVFEAYMSPGAVTEIIHFYVAQYSDDMKKSKGGGLEEEHEDIEVLEIDFEEVKKMLENGKIKDGKTAILIQYAIINKLFEL